MRIVVTGRTGQVVRCILQRANGLPGIHVVSVGRPELDLLNPATILPAIRAARPDIVVSAAAYTAVDLAEENRDLAAAVNTLGAGKLSEAAAILNVPIIHLSTDYVFSGSGSRPNRESDPTEPQNVYGRTKLAGEEAVAAANPRHVVLRTAWVYSPFGKNFVKTMLSLASERAVVRVVADQYGNPTSAYDIADGILAIAQQLSGEVPASKFGVFHLAGTGSTTWAGFAKGIYECSKTLGGPWAQVDEIRTVDLQLKARRPVNSCLATDHVWKTFGWRSPEWKKSCNQVIEVLLGTRRNGD